MTSIAMTTAKVLVADDDPDLLDALCALLTRHGFTVVGAAADGAEAASLAARQDLDVALLDLRMPQMDGIEAARRIKERDPLVQVIVLSAYDDAEFREDAEAVGVYCYLVKGCPPYLIQNAIVRASDLKRQYEIRASDETIERTTFAGDG